MSQIGIAPPGFKLPDDAHIESVTLQVADLDRSISYYRTVLGLDMLERSESSAKLGVETDNRALVNLIEKRGARAVPRRGLLGLYHFAVLLPDRAALGRFVAHLGEIGQYAGMSDHLVSEAVYLTDPDGLGIEVYADRPRETWHVADDQLQMATKPLDVESVIAAAGGQKWNGMPAGTKIGHVHFYVGDIDTASRFYHEGLGLSRIVWSYPGALFMSAGGYHHHVAVNTWAAGASPASDDDARLLHWQMRVLDPASVRAASTSLVSAGFEVKSEAGAIVASDPWGIRLRLRSA